MSKANEFTTMARGELEAAALAYKDMASAMLNVAHDYEDEIDLNFEIFIADATEKCEYDIIVLWEEIKKDATESEILERIENEFTEAEVEHMRNLFGEGRL